MLQSGVNLNEIRVVSINDSLHTHREDYEIASEHEWKRYRIGGSGGETVRSYWNMSAQGFKDKMCRAAQKYPKNIQDDMVRSIHKLIDYSYNIIKKKHQIVDDDSKDYPMYMYREIRNRGHCGEISEVRF